jgi:hypothetical protein
MDRGRMPISRPAADRPTAGPASGATNGGTPRERPGAQALPNPNANVSSVIAASTMAGELPAR